jgi:hypothetical protein
MLHTDELGVSAVRVTVSSSSVTVYYISEIVLAVIVETLQTGT